MFGCAGFDRWDRWDEEAVYPNRGNCQWEYLTCSEGLGGMIVLSHPSHLWRAARASSISAANQNAIEQVRHGGHSKAPVRHTYRKRWVKRGGTA
jgi:hypothetical protein